MKKRYDAGIGPDERRKKERGKKEGRTFVKRPFYKIIIAAARTCNNIDDEGEGGKEEGGGRDHPFPSPP